MNLKESDLYIPMSVSPSISVPSLAIGALTGIAAFYSFTRLFPSVSSSNVNKPPVVVTVTGAAGQIGYSLLFSIASGRMLGPDQPVELRLLDLKQMEGVLKGIVMELDDCAYPLLHKAVATSDLKEAFQGCQIALLVGARPRGPGMDRRDLLKANASIFEEQGKALNDFADRKVKILVVGNPANTNALICMTHAPALPRSSFSAMTRLDQNRAVAQLSKRLNTQIHEIQNVAIWGNHSNTQYPDVNQAIRKEKNGRETSIRQAVGDDEWLNGEFIKTVQMRGGAIIQALNKSSAASAANAAIEHVRDWVLGTKPGQFVSMGVLSDGSYCVPPGLIFSFPVECKNGEWKIVQGLKIDEFSKQKLIATTEELQQERKDALGI